MNFARSIRSFETNSGPIFLYSTAQPAGTMSERHKEQQQQPPSVIMYAPPLQLGEESGAWNNRDTDVSAPAQYPSQWFIDNSNTKPTAEIFTGDRPLEQIAKYAARGLSQNTLSVQVATAMISLFFGEHSSE
ncbi:hypothetical protein QAD02_014887 [Eretmocerus hayati]|uniref:Uncharacterized protein n=1 Tax=Eretmocerus hayati TaxID=131215 RepID=A0ACC2P6R9_9HYME|nr:hypothetical protein QAD02_014887 [Eretmocerus hayati]